MTTITPNSTYEDLVANAREQSRSLRRYAAVVEVVCYLQSRSYRSVMVSTTRIKTQQRGRNTFVGVCCQFHNGLPLS